MILREVPLGSEISGTLYLSGMPGLGWRFAHDLDVLKEHAITWVVCLARQDEILGLSPDYAEALIMEQTPWPVDWLPIPLGGVPEMQDFAPVVSRLAEHLRGGERVLVHCLGGIGRTGTTAICTLMALGWDLEDARLAVLGVGSGPETETQEAFVALFAATHGRAGEGAGA